MQQYHPLSLYIHIPWCIRKCPYCDFYSESFNNFPAERYLECLIRDLNYFLPYVQNRKLISIFFGGGTPSLLSADVIEKIITCSKKKIGFEKNIEITLEANPKTFSRKKIKAIFEAGVNRLSIGAQSFQNEKLKILGRIHSASDTKHAIEMAARAGFNNINLDLMYGLPKQNIEDAVFDLKKALSFQPTHLSWYQLTLEKGTQFSKQKFILPDDNEIYLIEKEGKDFLQQLEFKQYEVSAFAKGKNFRCRHNLNYWQFGDYIGIGAGAHGKITQTATKKIRRYFFSANLKKYILQKKPKSQIISSEGIIAEFMLNALRLTDGFDKNLFSKRCGMPLEIIENNLQKAQEKNYIKITKTKIKPTKKGMNFLNSCLAECFVS